MAQVRWTVTARAQLDAAADYIATDSPSAADAFVRRIDESVARLASFPRMGKLIAETSDRERRELIVGRYRVVYSLSDDVVRILRVRHGARRADLR
jgi:toxin ParE1/3/4